MSAKQPCLSIHVAFYLWYGTPALDRRWVHWDHPTLPHWTGAVNKVHPPHLLHTPPDKPHSTYYPNRDLYSSSDEGVLHDQMHELRAAGVDSVMLSWWGQATLDVGRDSQGVNTDPLVPRVLAAAKTANLSVTWHIEPYGGRNASSVRADLSYLHAQYGGHAAVWHRALPLVFLYDVSMEHSGGTTAERDQRIREWRAMTDSLRGTAEDATLISLYHDRRDVDFTTRCGFDGAYTYFAADGRAS